MAFHAAERVGAKQLSSPFRIGAGDGCVPVDSQKLGWDAGRIALTVAAQPFGERSQPQLLGERHLRRLWRNLEVATAEFSVDNWNAVAVGLSVIATPANAADIDVAMPLTVGASEPLLPAAENDQAELMFAELSWLDEDTDEPTDDASGDEMDFLLGELIGV